MALEGQTADLAATDGLRISAFQSPTQLLTGIICRGPDIASYVDTAGLESSNYIGYQSGKRQPHHT